MTGDRRREACFGDLPVQGRAGKPHLALERRLWQRSPSLASGSDGARKRKINEIEKLLVLDVEAFHLGLERLAEQHSRLDGKAARLGRPAQP